MWKATFAELKSGSERFIAICVSRLKSLPELYIGYSRLSGLVTVTANIQFRKRLQSADTNRYEPLTTRLKFGKLNLYLYELCVPVENVQVSSSVVGIYWISMCQEYRHQSKWRKRLCTCIAANGVPISSVELITIHWIIPISSGSSPRGLCRRLDSILSASWFTTSNTVSAISFCQRSDTTSGKFLYNSWSASVSYRKQTQYYNITTKL